MFRKKKNDEKASGVAHEVKRNLKNTLNTTKYIEDGFRSGIGGIKARRKKQFAVDPEMSKEEFAIAFRNFRIQVQIYQCVAILGAILAVFSSSPYLCILASLYASAWYVIYIRDVHRGRLILKRWDLATTPAPLTWSQFFRIMKKSPKYLVPLK